MKEIKGPTSIYPQPPKENPDRGRIGDMGSLPKANTSTALSGVAKGGK